MSELWPAEFRAAAEAIFGKQINRTTFDVLARRVEHAFTVWRRRYQMTPAQEEYAWTLLTHALVRVQKDMRRIRPEHPYPYWRKAAVVALERVVNDPRGHEGFKRRADLVDVRDTLKEAFA